MEVLRFAVLGLATGSLYALVALGVVLAYRASGVLNFAAGTSGAAAAYVFYDLRDSQGVPWGAALALALLGGAALGLATQLLVMEWLRESSRLTKLIATLGVLLVVQGGVILIWGPDSLGQPDSFLPDTAKDLVELGGLRITQARLFIIGIVVVLALALKVLYAKTQFGLATSAVAENRLVAAAAGWSTRTIEMVNFSLSGALSALAGILLAPTVGLTVSVLTLMILPALAAALIGRFDSFALTVVGAMVIGVLQSEAQRYVTVEELSGLPSAIPLLVIVLVTIYSGRGRQARGELAHRLPLPGSGRIRPIPLAVGTALAALLLLTLDAAWTDAITVTLSAGLLILSVVVVTGYAGQLSLSQFALAGFGAWTAGRLYESFDLPFLVAGAAGVAATVPLGLLIALPALRTRGVNLAVVTLGLASMIHSLILTNSRLTGGVAGTSVADPTVFGLDVDPIAHPERYGLVVLAVLVAAGLVVSNVRRGRAGRRLLAVRANERAAASLGVGVYGAKLYAFGLAAALAALGGIVIAFRNSQAVFSQFDVLGSLLVVQYAVIGGLGWASGALIGGLFFAGGLLSQAFDSLFTVNEWLPIIGGGSVLLMLRQAPDGMASHVSQQVAAVRRLIIGGRDVPADEAREVAGVTTAARSDAGGRRRFQHLEIQGLTVKFGGVTALDNVSFTVRPGEVVGLIGPNGAGKTTLLDAVTGFARPAAGRVLLDGVAIERWSPERRSRSGLTRSWQAVELFEEMTVRDNLLCAADTQSLRYYLSDLFWPGRQRLSAVAVEVVDQFEVAAVLDERPSSLPQGTARLVGMARAMVTDPVVVLLDEPAAGLSQQERDDLGAEVRRLADEHGMGVVLVEHDVPLVMGVCDRIVVLDFGRQIAEGSPAEVVTDPAVLAAYLGDDGDHASASTNSTAASASPTSPMVAAEPSQPVDVA